MKRLLASFAACTIVLLGTPAFAGLGAAASKSNESGYEAWCGERGNDCKVTFGNGKITVDGKHSVSFDDITYITRNEELVDLGPQYVFGIEYLEDDMNEPEFAEIIFIHTNTSNRFWRDLRRACRKCKDRDATQVEVNIKD